MPDPAVILGSAVDTWATIFVAIGTFGAVAYALFRDLFVEPRRRPNLELRFDRTGNDQVRDRGSAVGRFREVVATPLTLPLTWSGHAGARQIRAVVGDSCPQCGRDPLRNPVFVGREVLE
jgi:hypothetical protein